MSKKNRTDLFSKSSTGAIWQWSIWSENDWIYMDYGVIGGESRTDSEHVPLGLATRTLEEQIISRINSRISKKLDSGYVRSIKEAKENKRTNSLGYKRPSKCVPWNSAKKSFPFTQTYSQRKLDGHHCNIVNDDGVYVAYSSNGKIIDTIPEILDSIVIPNGRTIEGELYHHGTILQTISSWVKRRQENTKLLKLVVYEIDCEGDYSERLKELKRLQIKNKNFVEIHHTDLLVGKFDVLPLIKKEVESGYEGLVLRPIGFPHSDGKRTKGAIKVKPIHFKGEFAIDDEFLVVDVLSSKDGWGRLKCDNGRGKTFFVSAPGTIAQKTEVLKNKENYIHKHVEIEFAGWTKSKIPQHPVAIRFREKHEE